MLQTAEPIMPRLRLPEINGLRGVAILAIIWHHLTIALKVKAPVIFQLSTAPLVFNGWTGVNLFFILSGFVLYLPYAAQKRQMQSRADALVFYKHRFFRLMPLYYLVSIATLVLSGTLAAPDGGVLRQALTIATFTFMFSSHTFVPSSNWALWSIGTEVLFSLVFPLLLWITARVGLKSVLVGALVLSLLVRVLCLIHGRHDGPDWVADGLLLGRLDEFVIGMMLAQAHVHNRCWRLPSAVFVGLGALLIGVAFYGFNRCIIELTAPAELLAVLSNVLDLGLVLLLLAALDERFVLAQMLRSRVLQVLGMACYSIYLWHLPVMNAYGIFKGNTDPAFIAAFGLTVLFLAAMTYRYIEFRSVADWRQLFLAGPFAPAKRPHSAELANVASANSRHAS